MKTQILKNRCNGFTLVEAMISLVILSVGLLGVAGMQSMGLRMNYDAYQRSQATILLHDISEKLRLDNENSLLQVGNPYAGTYTSAATVTSCNYNSMLSSDIKVCWQVTLRDLLPAGTIIITGPTVAEPKQIGLNISWADNWIRKGATSAETSFQEYTLQIHDDI